jgi:ABC-2 type transport system permease protein
MRGWWKFTVVQAKLYLREPMAAFFTLIFPLVMLFIFGSIYGNEPTDYFGGRGSVDVSVPAYVAMIISTVGLLSLSIDVAVSRENGILRRYRATPLRPQAILTAAVVVSFTMTLLGSALLILAAKVFYNLQFEGQAMSVLVGFVLSALSFFSLGFVIAGISPTARFAQVLGMVFFYPMLFLSGATIPLQELPESIRQASNFLPLTHVVTLLQGLWFGEPWGDHLTEVVVLVAVLVLGVVVTAKTFRWE